MKLVRIAGGGIAGSTAALAAIAEGAAVRIEERSRFPKHKVCGEFLSPETVAVFDRLGVLEQFLSKEPFRVRRMVVNLGSREKRAVLPEPAYGLSRYSLDALLWSAAIERGAAPAECEHFDVIATGRPAGSQAKGARLFGFKAHFEGPMDDTVELFFLRDAYVGINCIEGGRTNVCGLAPEDALRRFNFHPEELFAGNPGLKARVAPLRRAMDWLFTGPLEFRQNWQRQDGYLAGDALSFVDPFTGSGMLCAALTGSLAGRHAAWGTPIAEHLLASREAIARPYFFSSALRRIAATDWAERLLPFVPARALFRLTRPH